MSNLLCTFSLLFLLSFLQARRKRIFHEITSPTVVSLSSSRHQQKNCHHLQQPAHSSHSKRARSNIHAYLVEPDTKRRQAHLKYNNGSPAPLRSSLFFFFRSRACRSKAPPGRAPCKWESKEHTSSGCSWSATRLAERRPWFSGSTKTSS